jgi:hypothetical protein
MGRELSPAAVGAVTADNLHCNCQAGDSRNPSQFDSFNANTNASTKARRCATLRRSRGVERGMRRMASSPPEEL